MADWTRQAAYAASSLPFPSRMEIDSMTISITVH